MADFQSPYGHCPFFGDICKGQIKYLQDGRLGGENPITFSISIIPFYRFLISYRPHHPGHRSAAITEVYAELDQQKALEAVVRVG